MAPVNIDEYAYRTYQTGVDWIVRGVLHLILYRVVYYYVTLAPSQVRDMETFVQYVLAIFVLYLREPRSGRGHVERVVASRRTHARGIFNTTGVFNVTVLPGVEAAAGVRHRRARFR